MSVTTQRNAYSGLIPRISTRCASVSQSNGGIALSHAESQPKDNNNTELYTSLTSYLWIASPITIDMRVI